LFFSGGGEGDPHISTLDGLKYTFNGHGEFFLIKSDTDAFALQGRAQRAVVDGVESDATVMTSLVAKQFTPSSSKVEFRIDSTGSDIGKKHGV